VSKKRLAPDLPANLGELWEQMRRLLRDIEAQIDKARAVQEARWRRGETRTRAELLKLVRRLERALEEAPRGAASRRKAASRKSTSRKKASTRKKTASRKKTSRKKAVRKKTSRR